ncbi:hypothetical protein P7K49_039770 [Saguinus oedipus]|uniref:Uncharacterized protein n=1 Tax=Saguinus oedipus TaxID=9490 RepID=A0ABQ9TA97_SAGOE|nr:hypothetical protein P7K49_039770 [Saguinus oedipus]
MQSFTAISLYVKIVLETTVLGYLHRKRFQTSLSTPAQRFTAICLYAGIVLEMPGNACFEISPQKAFPDYPFNTRLNKRTAVQIEGYVSSVFYAEFYCYFIICQNSAGNDCFEISPQKAFADFPFNTRV